MHRWIEWNGSEITWQSLLPMCNWIRTNANKSTLNFDATSPNSSTTKCFRDRNSRIFPLPSRMRDIIVFGVEIKTVHPWQPSYQKILRWIERWNSVPSNKLLPLTNLVSYLVAGTTLCCCLVGFSGIFGSSPWLRQLPRPMHTELKLQYHRLAAHCFYRIAKMNELNCAESSSLFVCETRKTATYRYHCAQRR